MSGFGQAFAVESVAEAAERDEKARSVGLGFDFLAEVVYLRVDDAVGDMRVDSPDFIEQLCSCEDTAGVSYERGQQFELERRKVDSSSCASKLAAPEVQFRVAETVDIRKRVGVTATQVRLDAGAQFFRTVGFGDVVIRAEFQAEDLLSLLRFRCQQNNRASGFLLSARRGTPRSRLFWGA